MSDMSAGILLFRFRSGSPEGESGIDESGIDECGIDENGMDVSWLEVLLVHPGGPFWAGKDEGAWSIPKGICQEDENPLQAAKRELFEETGFSPACPDSSFLDLGAIRQPSRKTVHVWALHCDNDCRNYDWNRAAERSNPFTMEWPKRSGTMREFPEIDRAEWFDLPDAKKKILKGQAGFLDRLDCMIKTY